MYKRQVHGALATVNSANNLISQNGRVHIEDNEGGISIPKENQIPREKLNSPTKPGNAPTFTTDGKSVEIHHENQNPNGPFREIHPDVHRKIPNPIKQSKIDRKKFAKDRRNYWKKEFPSP